jgi:serine/threonine-protein kinase HipA
MSRRCATYHELAETVRHRFTQPEATCHELFARVACNILVGNTDDHARNHAAFWDGAQLTLTPAYDICPQARSAGEATQAAAIVDRLRTVVYDDFNDAADEVGLTASQRKALWGRQLVNPSIEHPA